MRATGPRHDLVFARIPAGEHVLGWRFDQALPVAAREAIEDFVGFDALMKRFSPLRRVMLPTYEIATTAMPLETLLGDVYDIEASTLGELCDLVDAQLAEDGWRLPSEDELEAAVAGELFAWGSTIPNGIPYGNETDFEGHHDKNIHGLRLNNDPYKAEIVRTVLKFGDGGEAICGAYPWPIAWLTLSPSYRLDAVSFEDYFAEMMETMTVRAVKVAP